MATGRGLQRFLPGRECWFAWQGRISANNPFVGTEVRVGYWPHVEFDWTDAVRTAGELRAEHSLKMIVRAMDLFHIAIAIEVGAEVLLSFDTDQIALAEAAGLSVLNLSQKRGKA